MPFRVIAILIAALALSASGFSQQPHTDPRALSQQAEARMRALQREADQLAARTRTVLNELRALELERQIKTQHVTKAGAELATVTREVEEAERRVAALEAQRIAESPGTRERLMAIYKRGHGGYLRMLLGAEDLRSFARLTRGVTAVARIDRVRLEEHRRLVRAEQNALAELTKRRAAASEAQRQAMAAEQELRRAVAAHNKRLDDLDRQRDLAARYLGELESAQTALTDRIAGLTTAPAAIPSLPGKGDLDWPISGRLLSRFGRAASGRFGTAITRNGIEIGANEGTDVRAVHAGTVAYAAPFTGYGTLVIVDHGNNAFSLYGHLSQSDVTAGAAIAKGSVVGRAGRTPAGTPAVYFELRIDGRPVDPVQWLRSTR